VPALSPCARGLSLFLVVVHVVTPCASLQHRRATQPRSGGTRTEVARVRRVRIGDRGRACLVEIDPLLSVGREVTESGPAPINTTCRHRRPRRTALTDHGSSELMALLTHTQSQARNACGKATITMCAVQSSARTAAEVRPGPRERSRAARRREWGPTPAHRARTPSPPPLGPRPRPRPPATPASHARVVISRSGQDNGVSQSAAPSCVQLHGGEAIFLTAGCSAERLHGHDLARLDVRSPSPCLCLWSARRHPHPLTPCDDRVSTSSYTSARKYYGLTANCWSLSSS
jgi:hypothetical protein